MVEGISKLLFCHIDSSMQSDKFSKREPEGPNGSAGWLMIVNLVYEPSLIMRWIWLWDEE